METIEFLSTNIGSGYRSGSGFGFGNGDGFGYGYGSGSGDGDGYGFGSGDGSGPGSSDGFGYGYGYGSVYGYGFCDGSSYAYGDGEGIEEFNGHKVDKIDGVQTIITSIKGNVAKGFILKDDLTLDPCYISKVGNYFAHGRTAREAYQDALSKYTNNLPEEERIAAFLECHNFSDSYSAEDLFEWHNRLTGSCKMGRLSFCERKCIDLSKDTFTVDEFIELTENEYGGSIIKKLKSYYHNSK